MLVLWEVYVKIDIAAKSLLLEAFPGGQENNYL